MQFDTHIVLNQPTAFADVNLFEADAALREVLEREGGARRMRCCGVWVGKRVGQVENGAQCRWRTSAARCSGWLGRKKQGGSAVRANTTCADAVLPSEAQAVFGAGRAGHRCRPQLLSGACLPDGSRNQVRVRRLKDKLGYCSNASSEVVCAGAYGWWVGPVGRGIPTILEMASLTRPDYVLGSAATMRAAPGVWQTAGAHVP